MRCCGCSNRIRLRRVKTSLRKAGWYMPENWTISRPRDSPCSLLKNCLVLAKVARTACARLHRASSDVRNELLRTRKGQAIPLPRSARPPESGEPYTRSLCCGAKLWQAAAPGLESPLNARYTLLDRQSHHLVLVQSRESCKPWTQAQCCKWTRKYGVDRLTDPLFV